METWLQFLTQHGARISGADVPEVLDFNSAPSHGAAGGEFISPLTDLGVIAVSGDDAARFLHAQLTNDVEHLQPQQARLAGYCSPKGRLLATMLVWKSDERIFLQLPLAILPAIQKRLQMFVLRAKVRLENVSDKLVSLGLAGSAAADFLASRFAQLPAMAYDKVDSDAGTLIRMPDAAGKPQYLWITTPEAAIQAWPSLASRAHPAGTAAWRLSRIRAGIPQVTAQTQEQFVPQMINFELIGGVNFKKGCYPGQEIVARSQYLGKLKRRTLLASVAATGVAAGTEIFSAGDREQPCGMIVNAELQAADSSLCLAEIKLTALDAGAIHLASPDGPELTFLQMPYELSDPA